MVDKMTDRLADSINIIKVHELIGREECTVHSTKLTKAVFAVMQKEGYIRGYKEFAVRHAKMLHVSLAKKINDIGVIKPRFSIGSSDIQKYESRYIPSKDFGMLVISTSQGVLTSREVKERRIGGKLLAYVY